MGLISKALQAPIFYSISARILCIPFLVCINRLWGSTWVNVATIALFLTIPFYNLKKPGLGEILRIVVELIVVLAGGWAILTYFSIYAALFWMATYVSLYIILLLVEERPKPGVY